LSVVRVGTGSESAGIANASEAATAATARNATATRLPSHPALPVCIKSSTWFSLLQQGQKRADRAPLNASEEE
jgi:hypothetical protein